NSSKSDAVRPLTTAPVRSRTTTSTSTRSTLLRNTGAGCGGCCPCCARGPAGVRPTRVAAIAAHQRTGDGTPVRRPGAPAGRREGRSILKAWTSRLQYLKRTLIVTVRIGRTETTWPKVGELRLVSIEAHCTVLSRLSAFTCSAIVREGERR